MKAIFIVILSSLFCFVYSQPELTTKECTSDSGVELIFTESNKLEYICFTEDETNSLDITICHEKWEDSFRFYFKCDLWINLNRASFSETVLAIVLEDERIVYMYQDGEAPVKDEKPISVNRPQGKSSTSRIICRYSTCYDPVAVGEEIETMDEAWDALKSCKYSEIRLVFPGEDEGYSFYPEKEFKRDNASIFVDYFTAIDES